MKIITRELSTAEKVFADIKTALSDTTKRIAYVEVSETEWAEIYNDVAAGVVYLDMCYLDDLRAQRGLLGVPLRIVVPKRGK